MLRSTLYAISALKESMVPISRCVFTLGEVRWGSREYLLYRRMGMGGVGWGEVGRGGVMRGHRDTKMWKSFVGKGNGHCVRAESKHGEQVRA